MICPKCAVGTLGNIVFKKSREKAVLCEYCGALWLEGEDIQEHTGHNLILYSHEEDREYTFDEEENEASTPHTQSL